MKLSGFFSSTTASCTTTAIIALVCCPLVMTIRAQRESRRVVSIQRETLRTGKPLLASHERTILSVSRPTESIHSWTPTDDKLISQPRKSAHPVTAHSGKVHVSLAPRFRSDEEKPSASLPQERPPTELEPPSTFLVSVDRSPTPALPQKSAQSALEEMAFLPPHSLLSHPHSDRSKAPRRDIASRTNETVQTDESPADPLTLIPQREQSSSPTDWNSSAPMTQRADQDIKRAFLLADKGAVYSARKQLEAALQTVAHGLDTRHQVSAHGDCLACGLAALQEARDFLPTSGHARSRTTVALTAAKHHSRILTSAEREQLEPAEAMRRYFDYAEEHLVAAAGGLPVASEAFYGLGKLTMLQGARNMTSERACNLSALLLFQVAVKVNDANYVAANELGVLLAREGRLDDARSALQRSVAVQPMAEAWHNLTVVHERLGEYERSAQARMEWQRIAQSVAPGQPGVIAVANGAAVHWVDKTTFERGVPIAPVLETRAGGGAFR